MYKLVKDFLVSFSSDSGAFPKVVSVDMEGAAVKLVFFHFGTGFSGTIPDTRWFYGFLGSGFAGVVFLLPVFCQ